MNVLDEYTNAAGYMVKAQSFAEIEGERVVFSDSRRFVSDFGDSRSICLAEAEMRLFRLGSVISEAHLTEARVHSLPCANTCRVVGYRPPRYGRAALFPVDTDTGLRGMVDIKGVGVASDSRPALGGVNTGLLFLHEALVEVINAAVLYRMFTRDSIELTTIPFYALLDTGLRANVVWSRIALPCATLVRKAIVRPPNNIDLPSKGSIEELIHHRIEHYLLSRGLTTTGRISTLTVAREEHRWVARLDGRVVIGMTENICLQQLEKLGLAPPQVIDLVA